MKIGEKGAPGNSTTLPGRAMSAAFLDITPAAMAR
jgi:hypothetical protein